MLKILIADDHPVVREGLKRIIAETADMTVAGEAASGDEVIERVTGGDYDVIVLDISMPGRGWLDTLRQLRTEKPKLNVLILSIHSEQQYALRALEAGASGYLTKESTSSELITALKKVSSGGRYVSSALAEKMASHILKDGGRLLHETLSTREFEVMGMIVSGKRVKDIADELSLSVKTVSTYRSRIMQKMNLKSNAELIRYAVEYGLIDNRI